MDKTTGERAKRVLLIWGGRAGGRTEALREAVVAGIRSIDEPVELRLRCALDAQSDDLLWCDGLVMGTPEHFGYMSGALKDFFDRTFYPAEGRTEGLPVALFVSAGNDGRGTVSAVERIAAGYRWNWVAPPLIAIGDPDAASLARAQELGATFAAGLAAGIF
jgi:hypothetical protein